MVTQRVALKSALNYFLEYLLHLHLDLHGPGLQFPGIERPFAIKKKKVKQSTDHCPTIASFLRWELLQVQ